jgi:hypothetical protein
MATISIVSDLNKNNVAFKRKKAMLHLICELNEGKRSGEEEGYVSSDDVRAYFRGKHA